MTEKQMKKAVRKLTKEFEKLPQEIQDKAAFYGDRQDEQGYIWDFEIDNKRHKWTYVYKTGIVFRSQWGIKK